MDLAEAPVHREVGEEEEPTETKARAPFQAKLICGSWNVSRSRDGVKGFGIEGL